MFKTAVVGCGAVSKNHGKALIKEYRIVLFLSDIE